MTMPHISNAGRKKLLWVAACAVVLVAAVMARSAFSLNLPQILKRHAAVA